MTLHDALWQALVCAPPSESLHALALADWLQEHGALPDLERALRWMARTGRRPARRRGPRIQKGLAWYAARAYLPGMPAVDRETYLTQPRAVLPRPLFVAMAPHRLAHGTVLYAGFVEAVHGLAAGLEIIHAIDEGKD